MRECASEWNMTDISHALYVYDTYREGDHETFERLGELANSSIDVHSQAERVTEDENVIENRARERETERFLFLFFIKIYDER